MKAVIWTKYGSPDGLELQEIDKPTPRDNEVLIKVHAATVTAGDVEMRSLKVPFFLRLPMRAYVGFGKPARIKILGQELSGEIEAVGKAVTRFKVGDPVFGTTAFSLGGYAEYKCLPPDSDDIALAIKPTNMTYEEAATVPTGGLEAYHFLKKAHIQPGQKVLVNGAGGSIGTYGVQIAKHLGAEVTAVDSGDKLDMLRDIGADHVVDYTKDDFTQSGQQYDAIFDVIGQSPFSGSIRSLTPNGCYLLANPRLLRILRGLWVSATSGKKVIATPSERTTEDLMALKELIEAGTLKSIIDRVYPLEQTAEAHRYADSGRKKGHIVIAVIPTDKR